MGFMVRKRKSRAKALSGVASELQDDMARTLWVAQTLAQRLDGDDGMLPVIDAEIIDQPAGIWPATGPV
jgi:hypothetical protein